MANEEKKEILEEDEKIDVNSVEVVVDRVEHGLVGSLRIEDDINNPIFRKNDLVFLRYPTKLEKKDYILYKDHDQYFLRRIMKYSDEGILVAGDNESSYHIIEKQNIVGKVIARQRKKKYLSLSLNPTLHFFFYNLFKYDLSYFRLKNRIVAYEDDINEEAFELAKEKLETTITKEANVPQAIQADLDEELDRELSSFLNPDDLVLEMQKELRDEEIRLENERLEKERKLEEAKRMVEEYEDDEEEYEDDDINEDDQDIIEVVETEENIEDDSTKSIEDTDKE